MVVKKEPLLLEAFGPCLPDAKVTKLASSMKRLHKTRSKTSKHACTVGPYLITGYLQPRIVTDLILILDYRQGGSRKSNLMNKLITLGDKKEKLVQFAYKNLPSKIRKHVVALWTYFYPSKSPRLLFSNSPYFPREE